MNEGELKFLVCIEIRMRIRNNLIFLNHQKFYVLLYPKRSLSDSVFLLAAFFDAILETLDDGFDL